MTAAEPVWVHAPARLHLGLIDLRGDLGRRFGSIGLTVREPSLLLQARPARELSAQGPERNRVLEYARRFLEHHGIRSGARLDVQRTIPAHVGLGSGTQIGLATARALAAIHGCPGEALRLATAIRRAQRSAIGTWSFAHGGFLLDGGKPADSDSPAPLLFRCSLPESWRCVLVVPTLERGLSGEDEIAAFRTMPSPSAEHVGRITRLVLMQLLPALAEADIEAFGDAVTRVQRLVGETFRPVQGAAYASPVVEDLVEQLLVGGAAGAGQSSWGPAAYGFVEGEIAAHALARRMEDRLDGAGTVVVTSFDNAGACCWRGDGAHPA